MSNAACFLCSPDPGLVYARSENFFAMLGHGPLGEGYSLIASSAHTPSMLDLDSGLVGELSAFTAHVRELLRPHYGPAAITEHGRVALCVAAATERHEPHCLHAHRLVFPGLEDVALGAVTNAGVAPYPDFAAAHAGWTSRAPYLYSENAEALVTVAEAPRELPRQFLRGLVAIRRGEPDLANWSAHPRVDVVDAARRRLGLAA